MDRGVVPEFNPYREWLGIESPGKPTYYQLLGIPIRESDSPESANAQEQILQIQRAAKDLVDRLHEVQADGREHIRDRLIERVERAASCLADQRTRSAYDERLARKVEAARARQHPPSHAKPRSDQETASTPHDIAPPPVPPSSPGPAFNPVRRRRPGIGRALKKQHRQRKSMLFSFALLLISAVGIGYLVVTQLGLTLPGGRRDAAQMSASTDPVERPSTTSDAPMNEPTREPSRQVSQPSNQERSPAVPAQPPPSPEDLRQLGQTMISVRKALAERRFEEAKTGLAEAKSLVRTPRYRAMVNRLTTWATYVEGYWDAATQGLRQTQAGEELEINGKRVMVVECNDTKLILRHEGRNLEYSTEQLPLAMRTFFAERWFDPQAPSTLVYRGAMLAASGESTDRARGLWRQAEASGEIDLGDLELVLEDNYEAMLASPVVPSESISD